MQASRIFGLTLCLVKAGLTGLSGAATTFATGSAIVASILGKAISRAAIAGGVTPTLDFVTGKPMALVANQGMVIVWCVDAGGNVRLVAGSVETMSSGDFVTSYPLFPFIPDTLTPFAYTIHKAAANLAGTFTIGVSNWNTAGLTHTVTDVISLPSRPQLA